MGHSSHQVRTPAERMDARVSAAARSARRRSRSRRALEPPQSPTRPFASYRVLAVTCALSLVLTLANLKGDGLFTAKLEDLDTARVVAGLEASAAMDALLIEEHLSVHGVLPWSLSAVGLPDGDPALEYERIDGQAYRVVARHADLEGVFDSRLEARRRDRAAEARAANALPREATVEEWTEQQQAEAEALAAEAELWLANAEQWIEQSRQQTHEHPGRERAQ